MLQNNRILIKFANIMITSKVINFIVKWLKDYAKNSNINGYVIGISGGIDSAVTSTLAAKTGLNILCIEMPINQKKNQISRSKKHIKWLKKEYKNVKNLEIDLSSLYKSFIETLPKKFQSNKLACANTKSRLRMVTLYQIAQVENFLVLGTGNKIEDFGIGFFTKYGDGGVDLSPIADLLKSEVYMIAEKLQITQEIILAPPTDGLWDDDKTDEEQIGATYDELEWAMNLKNQNKLSEKQKKILDIYNYFNQKNKHKMTEIPVRIIPDSLR